MIIANTTSATNPMIQTSPSIETSWLRIILRSCQGLGNGPKNHRPCAEPVSQLGVRTIALICLLAACDAGAKPEPPPRVEIKLPAPPKLVDPNLAYLPANADLVIKIDAATLRKSKLWPTYVADVAKQVNPGTTQCADYQPLNDVTSVMIGVTLKPDRSVLVFRGIDRTKMLQCLHAPNAAIFDGDFATVKNKNTIDVLTFSEATTMVVGRSKEATRPDVQANTVQDPALIAALKNLPAKAGFAIASRPGDQEFGTKMASMGAHLEALYGTVDVDAQLKLRLAMAMKTPEETTQLTTMMKGQINSQQVTAMFDRIEVNAQDRTMTLDLVLGETKLASLVSMIRGFGI